MSAFAFRFISGKYQGGEFPLPEEGEVVVGRAADLDLVLAEDMVSRKHAKLAVGPAGINITDLGSTNGTFVNGEKIRRAELALNDRILIGTSIFRVIPSAEMTLAADSDFRQVLEDIANRASQGTSMSGDLVEVPLPDLLQLFSSNKKTGQLTITGPNRGKIYMKDGQICFALVGGEANMHPMKAICRMVGWTQGQFSLEDWDGEETFTEQIEDSTQSVLMEAMRQHDELKRIIPEMPQDEDHLVLCVPMAPKLSELSAAELDTLQKVINFGTFRQVVDKSAATDLNTMIHLRRLLRDGYLEIDA